MVHDRNEALPPPLTSPECDLRGMQFMPLDTVRLLDSDLFALSSGDEFKAAVALWCKSWLQVPAASLPNDDRILAFLSGAKNWSKVKKEAMRGWMLCSDNRWYHPVVAEKAVEAMDRREDWREAEDNKKSRQQRWRERCKSLGEELRGLGITPPRGASLETLEKTLADAKSSRQPSTQTSTQVSTQASTVDGVETPTVDAVEIGLTGIGTGTVLKDKTISSAGADLPARFQEFWAAWPNTDRKVAKAKCAEKWRKAKLGDEADAILAHIRQEKAHNRQWLDGFEPAPLTYLNQRRWGDRSLTEDDPAPSEETDAWDVLAALRSKFPGAEVKPLGGGRYRVGHRFFGADGNPEPVL
ncbi:DUF1376 domain-containing protein [Achromobacter xylosoxidans]